MKRPEVQKCGLETWRLIAEDLSKQGWQSFQRRHDWVMKPGMAKSYATLVEFVLNYEHQLELLRSADRQDLYPVADQSARSVIVEQIIGCREAMRKLYSQVNDPIAYPTVRSD